MEVMSICSPISRCKGARKALIAHQHRADQRRGAHQQAQAVDLVVLLGHQRLAQLPP
jgi:hypothetical protein